MKFQTKTRKFRDVEISLTSLIDLFLNILVFFLISTSFNQNQWIQLNLPETKAGQSPSDQDVLAISLDESGDVYLNKQKISLPDLLSSLRLETKKNKPVILAADENISHGKVMNILDEIKIIGLNNISVLSQE